MLPWKPSLFAPWVAFKMVLQEHVSSGISKCSCELLIRLFIRGLGNISICICGHVSLLDQGVCGLCPNFLMKTWWIVVTWIVYNLLHFVVFPVAAIFLAFSAQHECTKQTFKASLDTLQSIKCHLILAHVFRGGLLHASIYVHYKREC